MLTAEDKDHIKAGVVTWCSLRGLPDPRVFDAPGGKVEVRVYRGGDGFGLLLVYSPGLDELCRRLDGMLETCCSGCMDLGIDTSGMGRDS